MFLLFSCIFLVGLLFAMLLHCILLWTGFHKALPLPIHTPIEAIPPLTPLVEYLINYVLALDRQTQ